MTAYAAGIGRERGAIARFGTPRSLLRRFAVAFLLLAQIAIWLHAGAHLGEAHAATPDCAICALATSTGTPAHAEPIAPPSYVLIERSFVATAQIQASPAPSHFHSRAPPPSLSI